MIEIYLRLLEIYLRYPEMYLHLNLRNPKTCLKYTCDMSEKGFRYTRDIPLNMLEIYLKNAWDSLEIQLRYTLDIK